MDKEPQAQTEGVRVTWIARLIARFAHMVVAEYRELESEPEAEKNPVGFSIPQRRDGS